MWRRWRRKAGVVELVIIVLQRMNPKQFSIAVLAPSYQETVHGILEQVTARDNYHSTSVVSLIQQMLKLKIKINFQKCIYDESNFDNNNLSFNFFDE
jgi:hypothetical protein